MIELLVGMIASGKSTYARQRFQSDPRGRSFEDWLKVAEHHAEQARLEPLSETEGFAEIRVEKGPWDQEVKPC